MKPRLLGPLFVAIALLAFGAVVTACDGDGLTMEEYFQQFEALDADIDAKLDTVEQDFPTAFQETEATLDLFEAIDAIFSDGIDQLDGLDPPDDVKAAHDEFRASAADQQELVRALADDIDDADSAEDLLGILESRDAEMTAAGSRIEAACLTLQTIATDSGIDIDLECEE